MASLYVIHGYYSVSDVPSWCHLQWSYFTVDSRDIFALDCSVSCFPPYLPVLLPPPTSCHSEPGLSLPPSLPPPSVPPSSHEFIMWSKIEQWLFVPIPACHWSRMNNSALVVEVGISEERGNYFGAAPFELFLKRRTVTPFLPRAPRLLSLFPLAPARPSHQFTT